MKTLFRIIAVFTLLIGTNVKAQNPDQNPNFKESQTKYTENAAELTKNQGQTIQDTYVAYDWTENKQNLKNERIQRRQDRRLMRQQPNTICYSSNNNGYGNYNNGGYYNNNYNNNGYSNNGYYGNNYNSNNGGNGYANSINNWGSALLTTAVLGTTLYYLFK